MTTLLRSLSLALLAAAACGGSTSTPPDGKPTDAPTTPDTMPPPPDASQLVTIGNGTPVCQGQAAVDPTTAADVGPNLTSEVGDPALARITPPSYPFKVTSVSYRLTGMENTCGTNIAHAVSVFAATSATTPPPTPDSPQRIPVEASATDQRTRVVTVALPTPITLTAGQDLYVAVEMDANPGKTVAICLDGCLIPADDDRNFWSEQTAAPFTWDSLYSFGIEVDYAIWAQGEAL
ncbi:MAG: hypothetical protein K8W52_08230 [Deltaproteobacteria bacterium]|nr:hypothetical protein [Deltaproteobacteria bacterium]